MVVELGVVVVNALEEQVARLLEVWVNGQIERVVVREERWLGSVRVCHQRGNVWWEVELLLRNA